MERGRQTEKSPAKKKTKSVDAEERRNRTRSRSHTPRREGDRKKSPRQESAGADRRQVSDENRQRTATKGEAPIRNERSTSGGARNEKTARSRSASQKSDSESDDILADISATASQNSDCESDASRNRCRITEGHFAQEKQAILARPSRPHYPALRRTSTYTSIPVGISPPNTTPFWQSNYGQQRHSSSKWLPSGRRSTRAWRVVQDAANDIVTENREHKKYTHNRNAEEFRDVKNMLRELSMDYYNFYKGGQPYSPQKIMEANCPPTRLGWPPLEPKLCGCIYIRVGL